MTKNTIRRFPSNPYWVVKEIEKEAKNQIRKKYERLQDKASFQRGRIKDLEHHIRVIEHKNIELMQKLDIATENELKKVFDRK